MRGVNVEKVVELIKSLVAKGFWGQLVLKFEGGKVVMIEKTEKMKP